MVQKQTKYLKFSPITRRLGTAIRGSRDLGRFCQSRIPGLVTSQFWDFRITKTL